MRQDKVAKTLSLAVEYRKLKTRCAPDTTLKAARRTRAARIAVLAMIDAPVQQAITSLRASRWSV